jgi:hypothetical protein
MKTDTKTSCRIVAAFLGLLGANGLAAQDLPKVPRDLPDLHDLKLPPTPVDGKAVLPPPVLDPSTLVAERKPRAGIDVSAPSYAAGPTSIDATKVYYDDRGDGTILAEGRTYKASFDANGFTYVPYFGAEAPKDYPVCMAVRSARVGTRALTLTEGTPPKRSGDRVVYDRGSVQEIYDLKPHGVEQTIRVLDTDAAGAVKVEIGVTTELAEDAALPGIQLGNALGRVDYGAASLIRTDGGKSEVGATFANGAITLEVAEGQREALGVPVTIDPLVTTFGASSATYVYRQPDIAYDVTTDSYLVVWERVFSATDSDVFSELRGRAGGSFSNSLGLIDISTAESWTKPRVANLNAYDRFLVVAEVKGSPTVIRGRTREAAMPVVLGAQFTISVSEAGDKTDPDVGGDPGTNAPTYWTVVYTRNYSATDTDVHARQVESTGTLHGSTILLENTSNSVHYGPQISNCNGVMGWGTQAWMVVWTYASSASDHDILGATIEWDGTIHKAPFGISTSLADDHSPTTSSPADAWTSTAGYLVAFERADNHHIMGTVLTSNATALTPLVDLTLAQGLAPSSSNRAPSVDSDGCRFALTYYQGLPGYVVPLHFAFGTLGVSEPRTVLDPLANAYDLRICSIHSGRGGDLDYGIVYTDGMASPAQIRGAIFEGYAPGGISKRTTGCGGLGITASGMPSIGRTVSATMTGAGTDLVGMLLGVPGSTPLCGSCTVGVDLSGPVLNRPNTSGVTVAIPCQGAFLGTTFSVQGYALGTPSCFSLLRLGDTADFKIQ